MSGHSKWANIKHRKAVQDAKKANVFTKLARDITIAAQTGGDPEMNFQLKIVIERAKSVNMPKDNIERAIKKGAGEDKDGAQIEEVFYEAYGPDQVAMMIKTATDNKNRTLSEVKTILKKNGGKFAQSGSVDWQFEDMGKIEVELAKNQLEKQESLELKILETDATDYEFEEELLIVYTAVPDLQKVKEQLDSEGFKITDACLIKKPQNAIEISDDAKESYEKLLEALDDQDDVVDIFDNLA